MTTDLDYCAIQNAVTRAIELETLAVCRCLDELHSYIVGSSVVIGTDHRPHSSMHKKKRTFCNKRVHN